MKKITLLSIAAILALVSFGQSVWGIKAGINISSIGGDGASSFGTSVNPNLGGTVKFKINNTFSIQPEAMLSFEGAKISNSYTTGKMHMTYLNFPIMANINAAEGFSIQTGPQLGFLMSANQTSTSLFTALPNRIAATSTQSTISNADQVASTTSTTVDIKDYMKSTSLSWSFGALYEIPKSNFATGIRYNLGVTNVNDNDQTKNHINVFQINAYYLFKK
jgi:hypothetical protein